MLLGPPFPQGPAGTRVKQLVSNVPKMQVGPPGPLKAVGILLVITFKA